jgi:ribosomal protein L34E
VQPFEINKNKMAAQTCIICGEKHDYQSGFFTRHLLEKHNMSLRDYVILRDHNGIEPKCQCGYCKLPPTFSRGKFKKYAKGHTHYDYLKEQWIKKNGIPKCPTCGSEVKSWNRGEPRRYCNIKCRPSTWNQDKIKKTVKERYGVDNVYQIIDVVNKIQSKIDHTNISKKAVATKKNRYDNGAFDPNKMKKAIQEKYGVDHILQLPKHREAASKRIIEYNSDPTKHYQIKKYKETNLYYQSSYEKDFLELCESLNILDRVKNGNSYEYLDKDIGHRLLTDFSINDIEIEIKSTYILKKQGGLKVLNAKRKAVESNNKKYIVILDKDYSEFNDIIYNIKDK